MSTRSSFEPDSGGLALSPVGFRALVKLARTGSEMLDADELEELRLGSILLDEAVHPQLVPMADCLARPHVRVVMDQSSNTSQVQGWLDERIAVLARTNLTAPMAPAEVVVLPRAMLAFRLAKLLRLGPRPRTKVSDPVELDEALLETFLAAGEPLNATQIQSLLGPVDEVIPEWLDVLGVLSTSSTTRWRVGAWWNSAEESPTARSLEVVEGEVGSFLVTHVPKPGSAFRRVVLHPLTATTIWRLLCRLVPGEDEVAAPLSH